MARNCAEALQELLNDENESAYKSFLEAKDDLLIIQQLGLTPSLKTFFSSTNPIESLNSLVEEDLRRVKTWHDSHQFQRWLAASSLSAEKRMHKIRGYKQIPALRAALSKLCAVEKMDCLDNNALTGS